MQQDLSAPLTFATASSWPETLRMRSGLPGMDSDTVTRADDFSYEFSATSHAHSRQCLASQISTDPDLVDMRSSPADDHARVLGDNQTSHRDLLNGWLGGLDGCRWDG
jgi:hypothetical protein